MSRVFSTNAKDGQELVQIPQGRFVYGKSKRGGPTWMELPEFYLGRHPVTNRQFALFVNETGYKPPEEESTAAAFLSHWEEGRCPTELLDHPVVFVSYHDAKQYCSWAGLVLPTEWMWEKAARGVDGRRHPWGRADAHAALCNVAVTRLVGRHPPEAPEPLTLKILRQRKGKPQTVPVGSYPLTRTPWGCEDLIGNVAELCIVDGEDERVAVRGSSFRFSSVQEGRMTSAHRRTVSTLRRTDWIGFRAARVAVQ